MLPGLRTVLAAVFATPIVATLVAAALMRAPGESLTHAIAAPPLEHRQLASARGADAKEQSRMLGYAPVTEPASIAPETGTIDGGTSAFAKTQVDTAESETQTSGSAPTPVVTSANSQSSEPVATGSVTADSNASGHRRTRFRGLAHARWQARARAQAPTPNAAPSEPPSERDRSSSPL
jgi:hypothetical protein